MHGECSVCGPTESTWFCKGLCSNHYKQAKRRAKRKPVACVVCKNPITGDGYYSSPTRRKTCSDACFRIYDRDGKRTRQPIPCVVCGSFDPNRRPDAKYCGNACKKSAEHQRRLVARPGTDQQCCVEGCAQLVGAYGNKGMCRTHARKAHRARRPDHYRAKLEARRRRVRQQTPPWADMAAIERIYAGCPVGYEVDHDIPLKGRLKSGLHVEGNLQYLPMRDNRRKGNR